MNAVVEGRGRNSVFLVLNPCTSLGTGHKDAALDIMDVYHSLINHL